MPLPVVAVLDNIRSLYNVGSIFRTADAAGIARLYLCGITPAPPHPSIRKTALGADERVPYEHHHNAQATVARLRMTGYRIAAIETGPASTDLFDWQPEFPLAVLFGNEVEGLSQPLLDLSDIRISLPMHGIKRSLNVSTTAGIVFYDLLRAVRHAALPTSHG
ncbi:MAG: RNA methyltransferase [Acidobacteriota bacterium]